MRPLRCHLKLPCGCFWCCCRPFPVGELDWLIIEAVGMFSRNSRGGLPPLLIDLVLDGLINLGVCLPLLALVLPVVVEIKSQAILSRTIRLQWH